MDASWTTAVVFSHRRWDDGHHRARHVVSRLAARRRVLFVEPPAHDPGGAPRWERAVGAPNVVIHRPVSPIAAPGFDEAQVPVLGRLVRRLKTKHRDERLLAWLDAPAALPLARLLEPAHVVYDCVAEVAGSPLEAVERDLLDWADTVFAGGPSLQRARMARRDDVYCLPDGVEAEHFGRARRGRLREARDQAGLSRPRLGFAGTLDERVDTDLLAAVADARPEWQLVMVGPTLHPALPRRPNIHYLGARGYADLPAYLTGWDVCLLPFARTAATASFNPPMTLEYMATERPIVSTPLTDVAEAYGHIVYLADAPNAFVAACERALVGPDAERAARTAAMRAVVGRTSWDGTVRAMEELIDGSRRKQVAPASGAPAREQPA